eukprot:14052523-Alexandrium_andersonii.AAC.1
MGSTTNRGSTWREKHDAESGKQVPTSTLECLCARARGQARRDPSGGGNLSSRSRGARGR